MHLHTAVSSIGGRPVMSVAGSADLSTAPELHSALRSLVTDHAGAHLLIDLDGVTGLDDAALGLLLGAAMRSRELGGLLELVCSREPVLRRLRASGLDELVAVRSSIGSAVAPTTGYTAVIFTSRRTDDDDDEYAAEAARMERLAAEQPGFLGIETGREPGGTGITVSYWSSPADATAWKRHSEHLLAQRAGRDRWYRSYRVRVATVEREYSYDHEHAPADP